MKDLIMPMNIQIATEAAPWFRFLLFATFGIAFLWLALLVFISWRRGATNLTPVTLPSTKSGAQPSFLTIDREAHLAALGRADAYDRKLMDREERDRANKRESQRSKGALRVASLASLFMSIFSLATLISGAVWQVTWIGTVWNRYTAGERIAAVLRTHPVAFGVCSTVICYHIISFFVDRKWRVEA